ncbi:MAG: DNA gyrase inhibitor YacG [Pirellula sp.]|nr:DNA gyrase inhibitor YacG [Pirellula sp.]
MIAMRCPTCERDFQPAESAALPFCSDRCRLIDLGRWLDEGYALPELTEIEDDESAENESNGAE